MTYSVYSLNFSSLFPQQSEYLMMITLYFLLSICWTLLSMVWFITCNHITTKADMPKLLQVFCKRLQKVLFCCFPSPSGQDTKTKESKHISVQDADANTARYQESAETAVNRSVQCLCCQTTFASCFQRHNRVAGTANEQRFVLEDSQLFRNELELHLRPIETTTSSSTNQINNEKVKVKCNFCNKCESCQAAVDKEKIKGKNKKQCRRLLQRLESFGLSLRCVAHVRFKFGNMADNVSIMTDFMSSLACRVVSLLPAK